MNDRIARRTGLDLVHGCTARADELAYLHPFGVGDIAVGVDFAERLPGVAHMDERLKLPIGAVMAEFMAAFAFGDAILAALHDEQMIADREQDALAPGHALLQHLHQ